MQFPECPFPMTPKDGNNAKRHGWYRYYEGKGRTQCPFPRDRADLKAAYEEGWDAARNADPREEREPIDLAERRTYVPLTPDTHESGYVRRASPDEFTAQFPEGEPKYSMERILSLPVQGPPVEDTAVLKGFLDASEIIGVVIYGRGSMTIEYLNKAGIRCSVDVNVSVWRQP